MIVSIYQSAYDKTSQVYVDVSRVLNAIKKGQYKNDIHRLRQSDDTAMRQRIKMNLTSICFSGMFTKREDKSIEKHSGLVILDFDHIEKLEELKANICQDKYTYAAFISPSGDGLKVLFKIPPEIENHESYYLGIVKHCKKCGYPDLDTTSKNISRICFASYDTELYLNENCDTFSSKGSIVITKTNVEIGEAQKTEYDKLNICAEMIRNASDGNKHHSLIKAARLAGGYIAGGYVEEFEAVRVLELEINKKNPTNFKLACKTIQDGIEYGKRSPISKKDYKVAYETIVRENIIIEDEPAKDVILCQDVKDKILYSYEHGTSLGETTHLNKLDAAYRMKRGELTLVHGIPNFGKSTFLYQLALIKSYKDGNKWGVFSPENLPVEEFYKDLIHAYIGKSTEPYHSNKMSSAELKKGIEFVNEHFFLIYPENDAPTPEYMNNRFAELVIKHNISGCITDPYNQLDTDIMKKGGREDQYLSWYLTQCKRFAVEQNLFYYIIAHPKSGIRVVDGNYEMPNAYSLSGGAMWNNKCDNILAVHRPNYLTDKDDKTVMVVSQKIKKQKVCGIPQAINLTYNRESGRYYSDGMSPLPNFETPYTEEEFAEMLTPIIKEDILETQPKYESPHNPAVILHNYKAESNNNIPCNDNFYEPKTEKEDDWSMFDDNKESPF